MNSGNWSAVLPWPIIGIHAALLPDGRVLTFGSDETGEQGAHKIYDIWDPKTGLHLTSTDAVATDEFCCAEVLDPITGNIIITGGDGRPLGRVNTGVIDVNTFDYRSGSLTTSETGHLNFPRWYGSLVSLGAGKFLEIGGAGDGSNLDLGIGNGPGTPELYTPGIGWTALPGAYSADIQLNWFYPRVWLSSNGTVFGFSTHSEGDNAGTIFTIDISGQGSVTNLGHTPFESVQYDPATMFAQDKILTIDKVGHAWVMDISGPNPTFTPAGDVGSNRAWSDLTVLANGTVLLTGGSNGLGPSGFGNTETETNYAQIWDPATNQWTTETSTAAIGRFYHSNALLLPDGTVLATGGGAPGPLTNLNSEIYTPAYLLNDDGSLRTDRPVITHAPSMLQQGQTFLVTLDNADVIQDLELIKFGNSTHSYNAEQRAFGLTFTHVDAHTLQVTIPANADSVTDGYWLLFANNINGTPSVAATIKIGQVGVDTSVPHIDTGLMLNGTASHIYGSNEYTLTTDAQKQAGSVMSDKRIDLTHDFDLSFSVLMGNKANAGDGIAFVLHNDPFGNVALGAGGGGLAAAGIRNGLAIQFDAHQNANQGDITANHTDFVTTDPNALSYRLSDQIALNNLTDGNWHDVHVYWNAATETLTYTFDGQQVGQLSQDLANVYFGGSSYVYLGFTGATGGASNLQKIQLNSLNATFEVGSPPGTPHPHDGSIFDVATIDQHVTLNGSATFEPSTNAFTLTPDAQGQAGSIIFNDKIDLTHDFNIAFDIYVDPKQAAEGIAFVLHNDPDGVTAIGDAGGGLGIGGLQNSLAIEFDTQQSGAPFNDPAYNHTDIVDTAGDRLTSATALNIVDGGWHQVGVTWSSQSQTLRYWVDGKLGGTLTGDIASQYLGGQTTAYVGLTGATGGAAATSLQQVRVAEFDAYFAGQSNNYANVQDPIALSNSAHINGSATYDSVHHTFVLTPDAGSQAGSTMLDQRIDLSYDFQASFDVYLGGNANGADGLAFVLQNDPLGAHALGGNGGNYGAIGIKNGLGIAFDTWQNAGLGDMAGDHTDLFKTGVPAATSRVSDQILLGNGNVTDGQWHNVLVSWDATDHTLKYWFDGQQVGQLNQDIIANYLGGSQYAYLGFTAGTSGAHNLQEVHLNSLTGWFVRLTGAVIQTDTNSFGSTSLMELANSAYFISTASADSLLLYAGALVTAGEFDTWVPIGAVQTASGYDVAWKIPGANEYTVWSTDSNGNYLANIIGVVPGNVYALESIETTFNQDLNGDGTIGLTKTVIQSDTNSFGLTGLTAVANEYFLYNASGSGPALQYAGAPVTAGEFDTWVPIGAVQTASGYDVAWKIPGANEYTVWSTDSNGNYLANIIGVVPGNVYALESIETTFNQDLNGDGTIGLTKTVIQSDTNSFGLTGLTAVADEYFLYNASGSGPALQYAGAPVTAGEFDTWVPIGAVQTATGYDVAWKIPGANEYTVWSTDSNGNYLANIIGVVPGNVYALESIETTFNQDLNGDGTIGLTKTVIQSDTNSFGSTSLMGVANEYFISNVSAGPALQYAGALVTAGEFDTWVPIGAVQTASGYDVAWKIPGANEYTVWSTDSNGNYIANIIGVVPGNVYALESIETTFNQDLNGDGTIGLTKTVIQSDTNSFGLTGLTAVANEYFLYNASGSGPALQYAGAPVTAGEFDTWVPIGAVQTASGHDVAWKILGANEYTVWSTDSNGNYIANIIGVVPGNVYALESIETTFNQDLNGDGVVGLYAAPGTTLQINASLAGPSGSASIGIGATLELQGADSASVTFRGSTGTLQLDNASTFSGQIFNFTGNGSLSGSDQIDLRGFNYNLMQDNYANGVLTVTDGNNTAELSFSGTYTLTNFKLASDGSGGTIVYDPPAPAPSNQNTTGLDATSNDPSCRIATFNYCVQSAPIALLNSYMASSLVTQSDHHGGTLLAANAAELGYEPLVATPQHA